MWGRANKKRCNKDIARLDSQRQSVLQGEQLESRHLLAVTGVRDVLYVRVRFSDQAAPPESLSVSNQITREATANMQKWSGNQMSFTVTIKDVALPNNLTHYNKAGSKAISRDATKSLQNTGLNTDVFEHLAFRFNGSRKGGNAKILASTSWIRSSSASLIAHELGHNLGLRHSSFLNPDDNSKPFGKGAVSEYGDKFSVMGGAGLRDWNAHQKWVLGHIGGSQVKTVDTADTATTIVTLSNHENLSNFSGNDVYLVRIPFGTDALYAEYRANANGVLIHRADATRPAGGVLIDGNANTATAADAALRPGQSLTARLGASAADEIRVSVNSAVNGRATITVSVKAAPAPPPSISITPTALNAAVRLAWAAPASTGGLPITDYLIQYSQNNGSTWTAFNDGVSTSRTATVTGLKNGLRYVFRVAATNTVGVGAYSSPPVAATPRA